MKILFLGGTGRLSKDIAQLAIQKENEVYLFTRGSNHRNIFVDERYQMIYGNIRKKEESKKILENKAFDVIVDFLSYNVTQLKDTLEVIDGKYLQYIFISTATVYKKIRENEIISEDKTEVGNDKWDYAINKYKCEQYINDVFKQKRDRTYTIVRPYVTYGNTRVPYPIVPQKTWQEWSLIDRIEHGQLIPVFDSGKTITTLTHTRDFAIGLYGLFLNENAFEECVNITIQNTTTWGDVLKCIENKLQIHINKAEVTQEDIYINIPIYKGVLVGDKGTNMRFNNSKICELVPEFKQRISLQDGIDEMIDFYHEHPELKKINMRWNGEIDRLCKRKGYKLNYRYRFRNLDEKKEYLKGRYRVVGDIVDKYGK